MQLENILKNIQDKFELLSEICTLFFNVKYI